jgi:hypothetical protein
MQVNHSAVCNGEVASLVLVLHPEAKVALSHGRAALFGPIALLSGIWIRDTGENGKGI